MQPRVLFRKVGLASVLLAAIALTLPVALAAGSGYSLSYSQTGGHASNSAVDLISASTSDGGGATIDVTFQVSGTLVLDSASYIYDIFFGGAATTNATAYALISNGATVTWISTIASSGSYGTTSYALGNGGSSLTFAMNKSAVGPSSAFSLNVWAAEGAGSTATFSWLGSDYLGGGGSNCAATGCPETTTAVSNLLWIGIGVSIAVIVVIVLVVVLVVIPKRRTPPTIPPMMAGSPPLPPPPASPPPQ